jgi:hypothetical protein
MVVIVAYIFADLPFHGPWACLHCIIFFVQSDENSKPFPSLTYLQSSIKKKQVHNINMQHNHCSNNQSSLPCSTNSLESEVNVLDNEMQPSPLEQSMEFADDDCSYHDDWSQGSLQNNSNTNDNHGLLHPRNVLLKQHLGIVSTGSRKQTYWKYAVLALVRNEINVKRVLDSS